MRNTTKETAKGRVPLLILLVTPSHLEFLDDDNPFIPKLLSKIFSKPEKKSQFDIVAAVVDRISYPSYSHLFKGKLDGIEDRAGFDGVSVAMSYSDLATPGLWSRHNDAEVPGENFLRKRPVLSFQFPCEASEVDSAILSRPGLSKITRIVQIPVANTLFHNGQLSTMFAARWVYTPNSSLQEAYVRTKKTNVAQQTFNMAGLFRQSDLINQHNLVLGLKPITVPRVIAAGLGNIIRELYISRESKEVMPASEELEKAVAQHIETSQKLDERPVVWALVTPRGKWVDEPQVGTFDTARWIERGSRLHKILSGGGGWGMKKGLLALDPEVNFNSPETETYQSLENTQTTDGEHVQELEKIIKPGDVVTFLLPTYSEKSESGELETDPASKKTRRHMHFPPSVCFGSAPSTKDMTLSEIKAADTKVIPFGTLFIKGHFGALSEQGMIFQIETEASDDSSKRSDTVVHTKIDNPYAYFTILGRGSSSVLPLTSHRNDPRHLEGMDNTVPKKHPIEHKNGSIPIGCFRILRYGSALRKRQAARDLHDKYHNISTANEEEVQPQQPKIRPLQPQRFRLIPVHAPDSKSKSSSILISDTQNVQSSPSSLGRLQGIFKKKRESIKSSTSKKNDVQPQRFRFKKLYTHDSKSKTSSILKSEAQNVSPSLRRLQGISKRKPESIEPSTYNKKDEQTQRFTFRRVSANDVNWKQIKITSSTSNMEDVQPQRFRFIRTDTSADWKPKSISIMTSNVKNLPSVQYSLERLRSFLKRKAKSIESSTSNEKDVQPQRTKIRRMKSHPTNTSKFDEEQVVQPQRSRVRRIPPSSNWNSKSPDILSSNEEMQSEQYRSRRLRDISKMKSNGYGRLARGEISTSFVRCTYHLK